MKEATIHFTETSIDITLNDNIFASSHPIAEGLKIPNITNSKSELLKLRLEAVIQKEAEEKYPEKDKIDTFFEKYHARERQNIRATLRKEYISWWQSLIERLPSEEDWEDYLEKIPLNETEDGFAYKQHDGFIYAINLIKSKLLPSLPSSLMCEYEEENGKIEVKKIWV